MNVVLYYNFENEKWYEGRDTVVVNEVNFPYIINIDNCESISPDKLKELMVEYREDALASAAYKTLCEYSDFAFKCC